MKNQKKREKQDQKKKKDKKKKHIKTGKNMSERRNRKNQKKESEWLCKEEEQEQITDKKKLGGLKMFKEQNKIANIRWKYD